jgi:t-SNARE complex subunit (syntaxin)
MPIDDHASGPLKQTAKDEQNVLDSRQKNINYHKKAEGDFYNKVKDYTPSSQEEIDKINKKLTDLNKNTNLRVNRYNKSLDSIKSVRKQKFDDLFK